METRPELFHLNEREQGFLFQYHGVTQVWCLFFLEHYAINGDFPGPPCTDVPIRPDKGIGFAEEQSERLFKPFECLHGVSSPYPGNGIGLAICQKVVERHEGSITAQGILGQGATFTVQLPLKQAYEEAMASYN